MKKRFLSLFFVLAAAFCLIRVDADAAKAYEPYYAYGPTKIGAWKVSAGSKGIRVKKGNGASRYIVKGKASHSLLSNGTSLYYTLETRGQVKAYRIKLNGKDRRYICTLDNHIFKDKHDYAPAKEETWLIGVYKNRLYFSSTYIDYKQQALDPTWSYFHIYDMKTKTFRRNIAEGIGRVAFYKNKLYYEITSGDMYSEMGLMNLNGTGKKVIDKDCVDYKILKGKLYYTAKAGKDYGKIRLYRADLNGNHKKALSKRYSSIKDFNTKYLWIWKNGKVVKVKY